MQPIEIETRYLDKIQELMGQMIQQGKDMRPLMRRVAGDMHDAVEENFEHQGREPGWQSLSTAYARYKAKKKKSGKSRILEFSGRLRSSITEYSDATSAVVGTNLRYAAIHQFGGTIDINSHSRRLTLKKYKRGRLKGKTRFVKDKKYVGQRYNLNLTIQAYKVQMPARPFLKLTEIDIQNTILRRFKDYWIKN